MSSMKNITTKLLLFSVGVVALVSIVVVTVYYPNFYEPPKTHVATGQQQAPQPGTARRAVKLEPGIYRDYSEDAFTTAADGRRILFFHAAWCPQCRQLDKEISDNKIVEGVTILKVDYDTNQALRVKYGVTLQTTLVEVDKEGNEIRKVVAYSEPTYANLVNQLELHL